MDGSSLEFGIVDGVGSWCCDDNDDGAVGCAEGDVAVGDEELSGAETTGGLSSYIGFRFCTRQG